jgi:hypothetical protein
MIFMIPSILKHSNHNDHRNHSPVAAIFDRLKEFHRRQARLPIKEKMKILIELQKIAVQARPDEMKNDQPRQVWQIT